MTDTPAPSPFPRLYGGDAGMDWRPGWQVTTIIDYMATHPAFMQALLFSAVIVVCWACEALAGHSEPGRKRGRAATNGLFVCYALPFQIGLAAACMIVAAWVADHRWGAIYLLPGCSSPWLKYGAMFVLLDFLDYAYHRSMHHVPLFWRFHLVHHTDRAIDVSTTVREHPGETVLRNGFLILWVFLTGASLEVLLLRQVFETVANITAHTSFRLHDRLARVMGWLLITPNLHHVHHHHRLPYTNSNYGDVFSVWDRLFGTLAELPWQDTVFGLDTHTSLGDCRFRRALAMPFNRT